MNYMSQVNIGGSSPGVVSAVFLFVFNTFFAIGWLGMTWLYPAEIVPLKIRAPANGLSTSGTSDSLSILSHFRCLNSFYSLP
jgi:hypothetical protein